MLWAQILLNGIVEGLNAGLLGLAFWLIYRSTRVFHVAFAAIYALPPFVLRSALGAGLWWPLGAALALAAGVALALGCEAVNHARLERIGASTDLHLIASLGTYIVASQAIAIAWGNEAKLIHPGAHPTYGLCSVVLTQSQVLNAAASAAVIAAFGLWLQRTRLGLQLRALAEDAAGLALAGHSLVRLRLCVFGVSGAMTAAAALLAAFDVGFDPYVGLPALLLAIVATVIGGRGSFVGPVAGGLLLGVTRSLVVLLASSQWKDGATFVLLTVFLLFRPAGLMGRTTRVEAEG